MLRDPRSNALVDNFASRWLELNKLAGVVPDTELYPEFDENLRDAMEQETRLFVGSQMHDNRSVVELLTADYSFLNERLATHYGIREYLRQPFPARHLRRRPARRTARPGERPDGHLVSQSHVGDDARTVAAREHARRSATAAAARHSRAQRRGRRRSAAVAPRADGDAPEESGVRVVPSADGSARVLRSRISTRSANGARPATARRSIRRRRSPTARDSKASPGLRTLLVEPQGRLRPHAQRRSCWPTRSAAASTIATCPPSAASRATRRPPTTPGRRSSPASSRARRSAWLAEAVTPTRGN